MGQCRVDIFHHDFRIAHAIGIRSEDLEYAHMPHDFRSDTEELDELCDGQRGLCRTAHDRAEEIRAAKGEP